MEELTGAEFRQRMQNLGIDPWAQSPFKCLGECKKSFSLCKGEHGWRHFPVAVCSLVVGEPVSCGVVAPTGGPYTARELKRLGGLGIRSTLGDRIYLEFDEKERRSLLSILRMSMVGTRDGLVFVRGRCCLFRWSHDEYCEVFGMSPPLLERIAERFADCGIEQITLPWDS